MVSTKRVEVLLSKFPMDNSSGPPDNRSSFLGHLDSRSSGCGWRTSPGPGAGRQLTSYEPDPSVQEPHGAQDPHDILVLSPRAFLREPALRRVGSRHPCLEPTWRSFSFQLVLKICFLKVSNSDFCQKKNILSTFHSHFSPLVRHEGWVLLSLPLMADSTSACSTGRLQ